jgi:crotonobetainyl-CoA:carnitine CoA-transferase CaiB-like acyl-CoA transferase
MKDGVLYTWLRESRPDIILTSISGFGQYGPYRNRPAFDPIGQAMSGLMSLTGAPVGQPLGATTSLVDRYTSLHATIGTLAALHHRDKTGEGQLVDCCLMDSALTMVEIPTSYCLARLVRKAARTAGRPTSLRQRDGDAADAHRHRRRRGGGWRLDQPGRARRPAQTGGPQILRGNHAAQSTCSQ